MEWLWPAFDQYNTKNRIDPVLKLIPDKNKAPLFPTCRPALNKSPLQATHHRSSPTVGSFMCICVCMCWVHMQRPVLTLPKAFDTISKTVAQCTRRWLKPLKSVHLGNWPTLFLSTKYVLVHLRASKHPGLCRLGCFLLAPDVKPVCVIENKLVPALKWLLLTQLPPHVNEFHEKLMMSERLLR